MDSERRTDMRLYFLRHATAEDAQPGQPDLDRRLTREGKEEMRAVARGLKGLDVKVDRILTSPAQRARETAALAAAVLGGPALLVEEPRLSPGCSIADLRGLLAAQEGVQRLMLVGHEPDFSGLIGALIGTGGQYVEMKKAGLARLDVASVDPGGAVLEWLIPPKVFAAGGR
jgi:phosphohistidine phosphatase